MYDGDGDVQRLENPFEFERDRPAAEVALSCAFLDRDGGDAIFSEVAGDRFLESCDGALRLGVFQLDFFDFGVADLVVAFRSLQGDEDSLRSLELDPEYV